MIPLEPEIDGPDKAATTVTHTYVADPPETHREYSSTSNEEGEFSSALDSFDGWSPKLSQEDEWMQIDLRRDQLVRGITIMRPGPKWNRNSDRDKEHGYVTKVKLMIGRDAYSLHEVTGGVIETGLEKKMDYTTVQLQFPGSGVYGRVVRIIPLAWTGEEFAMRAAVIADTSAWPDHQIIDPPEEKRTYSSVLPSTPGWVNSNSRLTSPSAWTAASKDGQWMEFDLDNVTSVSGVAMRTMWRGDSLVTKIRLEVKISKDDAYMKVQGSEMKTGCVPFDDSTRVLMLPHPVRARFVRIIVLASEKMVSMRAGLIVAADNFDPETAYTSTPSSILPQKPPATLRDGIS